MVEHSFDGLWKGSGESGMSSLGLRVMENNTFRLREDNLDENTNVVWTGDVMVGLH